MTEPTPSTNLPATAPPPEQVCTNCLQRPSDLSPPLQARMPCCAKCQSAGLQVPYCTRSCQLAHHKLHKRTCGTTPPPPFFPPPILAAHEALYATTDPRPSFLYFPPPRLSFLTPPPPLSINLSPSTTPLIALLRLTASKGNHLATTLLYSLLLDAVEESGGTEARLLEQLGEEYGVDVVEMVERDEEPEEGELMRAVGGEQNLGLLLEWQMEEAEKSR